MKISYKIVTYIIIGISIIHISLTPVFFENITERVMDFVSRGAMGIFLGFLNIAFWRNTSKDSIINRLCVTSNFIATILFAMFLFFDRSPQAYLVVVLFVYLTLSSFIVGRELKNRESFDA